MSLTLNMVGGGSKGFKDTDALLIVTIETNSTVTATKDGITITPTLWTRSADNAYDCALFSIPSNLFDAQNAWTITGEKNGLTVTGTVTIDSALVYEITLEYRLTLYAPGDQSGWTVKAWKYSTSSGTSGSAASRSYGANSMVISQSGYHSSITYHAKVDFTRYKKARLTGSYSGWVTGVSGMYIMNDVSGNGAYPDHKAAAVGISATGTQNMTLDISNLAGEYYPAVATARSSSASTFTVTGYWLE